MKELVRSIIRSKRFITVCAFLLGALVVLGIRFATYSPPAHTHYHANFAVFVNGQREEFKDPQYYQDVNICSAKESNNPKTRVHMHDDVNDAIHVHDQAVTWGNFFENIGWGLTATSIINRDGTVYTENDQSKLHIILNGQDYTDLGGIANRVIDDKDKLLLSYGTENIDAVMQQYTAVPATAAKLDASKDPKSCGSHENEGLGDRFKHLF